MNLKRIYFITLNWNTTSLLKDMIASVEATTPLPHQWIIVDNGSDEQNWGSLQKWAAPLGLVRGPIGRLFRFERNQGLILGHNRALSMAAECGEPYEVVLIDTDVMVGEPGWLERVLNWSEWHPEIGVVGLEHSADEVCSPAIFQTPTGYWYIHEEQTQTARPAEGESAGLGFALIRWPVLKAGLRFDPAYRMYYKQDDDLCFTVRARLGLEIWAFPVGNTHWGSGSLKQADYVCGGCQGKSEWDEMKAVNQRLFADRWQWALRPRRETMAEEAQHLAEMKALMERRCTDGTA